MGTECVIDVPSFGCAGCEAHGDHLRNSGDHLEVNTRHCFDRHQGQHRRALRGGFKFLLCDLPLEGPRRDGHVADGRDDRVLCRRHRVRLRRGAAAASDWSVDDKLLVTGWIQPRQFLRGVRELDGRPWNRDGRDGPGAGRELLLGDCGRQLKDGLVRLHGGEEGAIHHVEHSGCGGDHH